MVCKKFACGGRPVLVQKPIAGVPRLRAMSVHRSLVALQDRFVDISSHTRITVTYSEILIWSYMYLFGLLLVLIIIKFDDAVLDRDYQVVFKMLSRVTMSLPTTVKLSIYLEESHQS